MKPNTICVGRLKATETMDDFYCDHCCRQYEIENTETGEKSTITYSSSVETDGIDFTVKHDDEGWPYPEDIDATGCVEAELEEEDEDGNPTDRLDETLHATKEEVHELLETLRKDAQEWMSNRAQDYYEDEGNWDLFFNGDRYD